VNFCEHLLIDGYNLIHAWPELFQTMEAAGAEAAVQRLIETVRVLHDTDELRTSVVLDGQGSAVTIEHPGRQDSFSVVYTPTGMTADAFIEQMANRAADPENVIVATRDQALALTVFSYGGRHWEPDKLAERVEAARKRQTMRLRKHRQRSQEQWKRGLFDDFR